MSHTFVVNASLSLAMTQLILPKYLAGNANGASHYVIHIYQDSPLHGHLIALVSHYNENLILFIS